MIQLTPWFLATVLLALIGGSILHELTHYLMARLAGADAWFDWPPEVVYAVPVDTPTWVDRWINLSPQVIGLGVGIPLFVVYGVPSTGPQVAATVGWLAYTIGSLKDVSYARAHGEDDWLVAWWSDLSETDRDHALMLAGLGVAGIMYTASGSFGYSARLTAAHLVVAPLTFALYYGLRLQANALRTQTEQS